MLRVNGPWVWLAQDLRDATGRHAPFSSAELEALQAAADGDPGRPLAQATERYARMRRDLESGPGFVRVSGVPVDGQDTERLERFFLAFARHVGTPVSQTTRGDRIFRVEDAGLSDKDPRARGPNSRKALTFHSDRADVIAFLCVRPATTGGESIVVSAGAIHNQILATRPELLKTLYEPFYWKRHNIDTENTHPWYRMPVFAQEGGAFAVTLMQVLIERAHRMPELPDLTDDQAEALALVQTLAADPGVSGRLGGPLRRRRSRSRAWRDSQCKNPRREVPPMKRISLALCGYGVFLMLAGLTGYLSNPEKAKTALLSGGTFGLLNLALAGLALRGWRPSVPIAIGAAVFLGVVFTWRSTVSWMAFAGGQPEKRVAAMIISAMLAATLALVAFLIRERHANSR